VKIRNRLTGAIKNDELMYVNCRGFSTLLSCQSVIQQVINHA